MRSQTIITLVALCMAGTVSQATAQEPARHDPTMRPDPDGLAADLSPVAQGPFGFCQPVQGDFFKITVVNQGSIDVVHWTHTLVWIPQRSGSWIPGGRTVELYTPPLGVGESADAFVQISADEKQYDEYLEFLIWADVRYQIAESDEANNLVLAGCPWP